MAPNDDDEFDRERARKAIARAMGDLDSGSRRLVEKAADAERQSQSGHGVASPTIEKMRAGFAADDLIQEIERVCDPPEAVVLIEKVRRAIRSIHPDEPNATVKRIREQLGEQGRLPRPT